MSDKKNIDRLFQERFKDFETPPPLEAWDAIESQLEGKKSRRLTPVWWRLGAVAAALVILVFLSNYWGSEAHFDQQANDAPIVKESAESSDKSNEPSRTKLQTPGTPEHQVAQEKSFKTDPLKATETEDTYYTNAENKNTDNIQQPKPFKTSALKNDQTALASQQLSVTTTQKKTSTTTSQGTHSGRDLLRNQDLDTATNPVAQNTTASAEVLDHPKQPNPSHDDLAPVSSAIEADLETAMATVDSTQNEVVSLEDIARNQQKTDSLQKPSFDKAWSISSQVGPVFSNTLGGSSVNTSVQNNNMSTQFNLSYGLGVTYAISPKLSVRAGLHQVNLTYGTEDINYDLNAGFASLGTTRIATSYNPNSVSRSNAPSLSNDSFATGFAANEILNPNSFKGIDGTLSQQLGYLEVPLEIKYELLGANQGLSLHLLGGLSALFLTDNQVSVQNANRQLELGSDDNFNDFNQSANFGLGLSYQFTNHLGAFVEPTFKYQLNALKNNTSNFQPYTIGVQTGVSFKF